MVLQLLTSADFHYVTPYSAKPRFSVPLKPATDVLERIQGTHRTTAKFSVKRRKRNRIRPAGQPRPSFMISKMEVGDFVEVNYQCRCSLPFQLRGGHPELHEVICGAGIALLHQPTV